MCSRGWSLIDTHLNQGRTFQRPLDVLETCFLWDGLFNGTADGLHYHELHLSNNSRESHIFSKDNIIRAWVSTKRRFPLVGATICGADGGPLQLGITNPKEDNGTGFLSEPYFVVRERDLAILRPREIIFDQVTGAEEAQRKVAAIMHGPRPLSEELLVQLYVFHEIGPERTHVLHLAIMLAHCVTDGTATRTIMRCMLDTLARYGAPQPAQLSLEERLEMAIHIVDLEPRSLRSLSPTIRRWRRVVGTVIFQLRTAKRQGGHTLPCRLARSTQYTASRPGVVFASLTLSETAAVISNCRLHDVTFGNAFLVLAQVAMTRVLYRRYLRGEISEEEWQYRKRQPHINGGPLNLRRYLDKAWFDKGGGGEVMLAINLYIHQLPYMTLGTTVGQLQRVLLDGAPPFSDLLTFDRFLHRARLIKKRAATFFNHPLFLEILHAGSAAFIKHARYRTLRWMQRIETASGHATHGDADEDKVLAVTDMPMVWAHGGSSLGNTDLIFPTEYPLPSTHPLSPYSPISHPVKAGYATPPFSLPSGLEIDTAPKIAIVDWRVHLHVRPAELYLGAATTHGCMNMYVHYDGNVYEEVIVREWLNEVRDAVLWYLLQAE